MLRFFQKTFYFDPHIYVDGEGKPVKEPSNKIKWLGNLSVRAISENRAVSKAFKNLHSKHPELKKFIKLG